MSEIAMNAAHMIDMLPDPDKNLAYELIKKGLQRFPKGTLRSY